MKEIDAECLDRIRDTVVAHYNDKIDLFSRSIPYYGHLMMTAGAADYATTYLFDPEDLDNPDSVISQINKFVGDDFDGLDPDRFVKAMAKAVELVAMTHFDADLDLTADDFVERATTALEDAFDPKTIASNVLAS